MKHTIFVFTLLACSQPNFATEPTAEKSLMMDPADPIVRLDTSRGYIDIELFEKKAPQLSDAFLKLVAKGHWDHTIFHRIIDGVLIQDAGLNTDFNREQKSSHFNFNVKDVKNNLSNTSGTIAWAYVPNQKPTHFSFYINMENNLKFDITDDKKQGGIVFGKVIAGQKSVKKIATLRIGQREGMHDTPYYPEHAQVKRATFLVKPS